MTTVVNGKDIILDDSERTQVEVWDRVMGYMRPVSDWNVGKKQEHLDRIRFKETKTIEELDKHSKLQEIA